MREIVLDTETTGFDPAEGDRMVEIAALELENHIATGRTWHRYLNPERPMPAAAFEVHGLGDDFLRDKPLFRAEADSFLDFIGSARLVIHNASFDMKFLNAELRANGLPQLPDDRAIDTLMIARQKFPGAPASLDALCRRFGVDNSGRVKHGALLDCELLAEVYLELRGGRQPGLTLAAADGAVRRSASTDARPGPARTRARPLAPRITDDEAATHAAFVEKMGPTAVWGRRGGVS